MLIIVGAGQRLNSRLRAINICGPIAVCEVTIAKVGITGRGQLTASVVIYCRTGLIRTRNVGRATPVDVVIRTMPRIAMTFLCTTDCVLCGQAVEVFALDVTCVVSLDKGFGANIRTAHACFTCANVQIDI